MVYLPLVPTYDEQVESFTWERTFHAEKERRDHLLLYRLQPRWLLRRRFPGREIKLRFVLRYRTAGMLLDFGCGSGDFLKAACRQFTVTGLDISPTLARKAAAAAPEATIVCAPATETRLPAGSFDVITIFSYLEHEPHPIAALAHARELLKPEGVLILKTPNYASLNRRITGRLWCGYRFPDHCNYFTPETIRQLLAHTGFRTLAGRFGDHLPTSDSMYLAAAPQPSSMPAISDQCS